LYRSAQPDSNGFLTLHDLGVNLIFKLDSNDEYPIRLESNQTIPATVETVTLSQWYPNEEKIRKVVDEIDAALTSNSVLVHCMHGRDRTGMVIGAFRLLKDGWSIDQTLEEFKTYGAVGLIALADHEITEFLQSIAPTK
jgi:protein-tyrosine phosphatase